MPISLATLILFITSLVARQDPDLFGHIRIPDFGRNCLMMNSRRWTLNAGLWTLEFGRLSLDSWCWPSELWTLDSKLWTLDAGRKTLDSGRWTLGSAHRTLSLTVSEQNQNPVFGSAWLNYWKFFRCESLKTSWHPCFVETIGSDMAIFRNSILTLGVTL